MRSSTSKFTSKSGDESGAEESLEPLEKIRKTFSALSKDGSLQIFNSASSGLAAETGSWRAHNLSKRQYYSRVRELKDGGLIKKEEGNYVQTEFGMKIHGLLIGSFVQGNLLDDAEDVAEEFPLPSLQELGKSMGWVKTIYDYESLVDELIQHIKDAEDEFYIATNYTDHRVLKALLDVSDGVTVKALGLSDGSRSLKRLKAATPSADFEHLKEFFAHRARKCSELPYSFFLRDYEYVGFEIVNPSQQNQFFLGAVVKDREFYEVFRDFFNRLYDSSERLSP